MGQARHPDMPKVVFKILWENLKGKNNFHAIIKNLSKSGRYYNEHIATLYERLLKIEKANGMEVSERYFNGFLEDRKTTYDAFIRTLMKENAEEIRSFYNNEDTDSFLNDLIR